MKTYKMLHSVAGSRDGITVQLFEKGETYELPEDLATNFYHQGAVEEVSGRGKSNPADARETKVSGPVESKEGEAGVDTSTQRIEELNSVARDHYGEDTDTKMSREDLKEVVDEAGKDAKGKKSK